MDRPRLHAGESHPDGPLGPLTHAHARSRIGNAVASSDELRQVDPATESRRSQHLGWVDAVRLARTETEPDEWVSPGRDAGGTYFSPLSQINEHSVEKLGFAWQYALGTS